MASSSLQGSTLVFCPRMLRLIQVLLEGGLEQLVEADPVLKGISARPSRWSGVCCETGRSARDPVYVGLFGAVGIVLQAHGVAHLIQKFFGCWLWFHRRFLSLGRFRLLFYIPSVKVPSNNLQKSTSWHITRNISANTTSKRELGGFRPRCQKHAGRRIPRTQ